jgi:ribosomal protein S18 acetylase RimI-like enzyme
MKSNHASMTHSMNAAAEIRIEEWLTDASRAAFVDAEIGMLAEILHAVVHAGAGVSFFTPFIIDEARAFWVEKVLPQVRDGTRRVLVARVDERLRAKGKGEGVKGKEEERSDRIVGTVQLELEMPPNQRHRAAVAKLLVHPAARRRGIGRALMTALEEIAQSEGRTLLTLDTVSGSHAELLYRSLGFIAAGVIPRYACGALTPDLEDTTIMYKELTTITA